MIIREISRTDLDVMFELHSDPEVHRYLGNKTIASHQEMAEAIESLLQQYRDYGVGRWAMIDKRNNDFIGWTGLEFVTKEINKIENFYDLGYRLLKRFWGQGFATESAFASIEYAFDILKIKKLFAMADIENQGSNRILKKVGLKFIETFDFEKVKHNWYKLESLEYENLKMNR